MIQRFGATQRSVLFIMMQHGGTWPKDRKMKEYEQKSMKRLIKRGVVLHSPYGDRWVAPHHHEVVKAQVVEEKEHTLHADCWCNPEVIQVPAKASHVQE